MYVLYRYTSIKQLLFVIYTYSHLTANRRQENSIQLVILLNIRHDKSHYPVLYIKHTVLRDSRSNAYNEWG